MGHLTNDHMRARIERLEALSRGLAKEMALWKGRGPPLLAGEQRAYLGALQDTIQGFEAARAALAAAVVRIEATGLLKPASQR
jgi:hypothetical protein